MRRVRRSPLRQALPVLVLAAVAACLGAASPAPAAVSSYVEGSAVRPFTLASPVDPAVILGPVGDQVLSLALPVQGQLPFTAVVTSRRLDLGEPGRQKEFLSLSWLAGKPRGSVVFVSYSVDGGAWLPAVGGTGFDIPRGTHGEDIAYRVTLTTSDAALSPEFDEIAVEWTRWSGTPTDPEPGGGDGPSHKPGASHKPGSGSYTYPDGSGSSATVPASTGGSSGASYGQGYGTGGSAVPGGSGSASGSGEGSAASARGSQDATASAETTPTPALVPGPPPSAPSGPPRAVAGLPTDPDVVISGVPLEEAALASAAGGRDGPAPTSASGAGGSFPFAPIAGVAAALAVVIFVPWLLMAARLRSLSGADLEHARFHGPFRFRPLRYWVSGCR